MKPPSVLELANHALRGVKKITTFGQKNDPAIKVVDELEVDGDMVNIHRSTQCRSEERRVGKEGRARWSPYH